MHDAGNEAVAVVPDTGEFVLGERDRGRGRHDGIVPAATPGQPTGSGARNSGVPELPVPPRAERRPHTMTAFGDRRTDDWFWLRDRDDPATLAYLQAENAYTDAATAHLTAEREALFEELRAHVEEDDASAPVRWGRWLYAWRTTTGAQYRTHVRTPVGARNPLAEQVFLDENELAAGHDYFALGDLEIAPDHARVAYSVDHEGDERYELRVRDLGIGTDLRDVVPEVGYGLAWSNDAHHLFYVRPDAANRPHEVWCHQIGTPVVDDVCVYADPDERFEVFVDRCRSGRAILVGSQSRTTTELRWIDPEAPLEPPRALTGRTDGIEFGADQYGDGFVVWTNADDATNFALFHVPFGAEDRSEWAPLLPHDPTTRIVSADAFSTHLVVHERHDGLERLRIVHGDGTQQVIEMPDAAYSVWPGAMPEYATTVVRYGYSSLTTPASTYDLDLTTGDTELVRRVPVPHHEPQRYRTARVWATASDGTAVPISIVHRVDTDIDGTAPLFLTGYGAYEACFDPTFDMALLPLLDRGWVCAIAHPRGGGELGRPWYEQGRLAAKATTFTDFIACAEHLAASPWCDGTRIVARGGSAGGLLMGAVVNLVPARWNAVVAEVPFVDVVSTMQDATLPLTVGEWEEWGDPATETDYHAIRAWSPYDNLAPGPDFPKMLVTAGFNDPRVGYWEPAKYVAKVRSLAENSRVLLRTELGAGHHGPSGRYDRWRDEAFVLAWMLDAVTQ